MFLPFAFAAGAALAADPAPAPASGASDSASAATPSTPAPPPDAASLEARVQALEAALAAQQQADLLREAEALAAEAPPPPPQGAARAAVNAFNPGITAFGDVVGQLGVSDGEVMPGSTLFLRSLELELRADVDPFAKADAVIAFEQEAPSLSGGASEGFGAEPEEAYIELVSLPGRLSGRVGKFKLPFGIMNRTHPHDLPWVDVPPALEVLGEEGLNDTGISLSRIFSLGPMALTLTGGAYSGETFDPDNDRANLGALGRAELFGGFGAVDTSLGASIEQDVGGGQHIGGADFSLRYRPSQRRSVFLLAEGYQGVDGELGGYAALQVQPARNLYFGAREDFTDDGLRHNLYLTGYTSEFLRFRLGGGYAQQTGEVNALGQLTFVWGSHPVEPWWVNK